MPHSGYNCLKCIGYCCAIYERVAVSNTDLRRLARYFKVSVEEAEERYTTVHPVSGDRVLKRTADPIFGASCMFQHPEKRVCTIYEGRPSVCRQYPSTKRCVYYDMLQWERRQQGDHHFAPVVQITYLEDEANDGE